MTRKSPASYSGTFSQDRKRTIELPRSSQSLDKNPPPSASAGRTTGQRKAPPVRAGPGRHGWTLGPALRVVFCLRPHAQFDGLVRPGDRNWRPGRQIDERAEAIKSGVQIFSLNLGQRLPQMGIQELRG